MRYLLMNVSNFPQAAIDLDEVASFDMGSEDNDTVITINLKGGQKTVTHKFKYPDYLVAIQVYKMFAYAVTEKGVLEPGILANMIDLLNTKTKEADEWCKENKLFFYPKLVIDEGKMER